MFAVNNAPSSQAQNGGLPDLGEITTEAIGFLAIAGESKIRLLPEPWPTDSLPNPTSSLFSIASRNEILAAAAPNSLIVGSTSAVREAFSSQTAADNNVKPFTPQLTIPTPRISQVAFSADESCLIISADQGGGLAVYQVDAIKQGSTESAFQIGTNGVAVRALVPNPSPASAHLIALVLAGGQLMIADLKERALANTPNGPVLKERVSCLSWSAKGKQLVAGLDDGTCVQMDPAGSVKATIPRPHHLEGDHHVSGLTWLDNDHFLGIYNPNSFQPDSAPDSTFYYISRQPNTTNFAFQKLTEAPCGPFGMNRSPPHHFISRLRQFPPHLSDTLIVSSTASGDIGLITCSETPLSSNAPDSAKTYTTTTISEDSRKAQLPTNSSLDETSPIGMALDLSSKDTVSRPIPSDEIDTSATPLPNLMVLNHEGVLASWWFVYADSIRQRQAFPGLIAVGGGEQQQQQQHQNQTPTQPSGFGSLAPTQSPFGSAANKSPSPFAQASAPAFGTPSALGARSGSAFGSSSMLGAGQSPWSSGGGNSASQMSSGSGFGKPTFGSSSSMGQASGFGAVGGLGNRSSPWGGQTSQPPSQTGGPNPFSSNTASSSPFASIGQQSSNEASKPFGGFGDTSATSGFGNLTQSSTSVFGTPSTAPPPMPSQPSFGSTVTIGSNLSSGPSTFGEPKSAWGTPALSNNPSDAFSRNNTFGSNQESNEAEMTSGDMDMETPKPADFKLQSSFKPDDRNEEDLGKPSDPPLFGSAFNTALGDAETTKQASQEATSENPGDIATKDINAAGKSNETVKDNALAPVQTEAPTTQVEEKGEKVSSLEDSPVLVKQESSDNEDVESAPLPPDPSSPEQAKSPRNVEEAEPPLPPDPSTTLKLPSLPKEVDEQSTPLPSDPIAETPSKPQRSPHPPAPLPPSPGATTTPARPQPAEKSSSELPASPPSETPLRLGPSQETLSTTPQAPPPDQQSPIRQNVAQSPISTTPTAPPPGRQHTGVFSTGKPTFQASRLSRVEESPARSEPKNESESGLPEGIFDDSDIHIQHELAAPTEPTKQLASFLTHQDYVSNVSGQGLAAQIEKVYRDINSMIDTLGLNAKSVSAFVAGHEQFKDGGRIREDLEAGKEDDWCLIEIADLSAVEKEVEENLDEQRLKSVGETVTELQEMQKDLNKLQSRHHALQQLIRANQGIDGTSKHQEAAVNEARQALTTEQSILLSDLRKQFSGLQQQLAQAEDSLTMLRAKVSSIQTSLKGDRAGSKRVPTFEGVANTISKMTRMVEQRSGDVDLLEAQMRRLKSRSGKLSLDSSANLEEVLGKLSLGSSLMSDRGQYSTPPGSRGKGTAADYHTPPNRAKSNGTGSSQFQLNYDEESADETYLSPSRRSIQGSGSRMGRQTTGKAIPEEEVDAFNAKEQRRAKVLALLKKEVCKRGTLVHRP